MDYAHPEVLVNTQWVADHLKDSGVRIAEVDYDPVANYEQGHIEGSVLFDWRKDLNHPLSRDILSQDQATELLRRTGVSDGSTLILYGDFNNWFAAFAFWDLKYYGFKNIKIMNGGRKKWIEEDKPLSKDRPSYPEGSYTASPPNDGIRAYFGGVRGSVERGDITLIDVRSPKEFSGEILAPPEYPTEHAQRGGHIPGAKNIPWGKAVNEDGTFKSADELKTLYESNGVTGDRNVITYCRIGERSSHTWFVLTYLLGYQNVVNYDGSWTEYGNMIRNRIQKP